jgi:hypothetical protein
MTAETPAETYAPELIVLGGDRVVAAPHHDCGGHA